MGDTFKQVLEPFNQSPKITASAMRKEAMT